MKLTFRIGGFLFALGSFLLLISCASTKWFSFKWNTQSVAWAKTLGPKLNTEDEEGHLALVRACVQGIDAGLIEQLIAAGADVNLAEGHESVLTDMHVTPLQGAMETWVSIHQVTGVDQPRANELRAIILLLLRHGADCNYVKRAYFEFRPVCVVSPLILAISEGDPVLVDELLSHKAKVDDPRLTYSPLEFACRTNQDVPIFHALIEAGAHVLEAAGNERVTVLHHAALWNTHPKVIEELVQHGLAVDAETRQGNTPLFFAMFNRNARVLYMLHKLGANLEHKNTRGDTPLVYASCPQKYLDPEFIGDHIEMMRAAGTNITVLVGLGADPSVGEPLVMAAGFASNELIVRALLNLGCSPIVKMNRYFFPGKTFTPTPARQIRELFDLVGGRGKVLYDNTAAIVGSVQSIKAEDLDKALHNMGWWYAINADLAGKGVTALMVAAASNPDPRVIDILIGAGADPTRVAQEGFSALGFALTMNPEIKVAERLLAGGAVVDTQTVVQGSADPEKARLAVRAWGLLEGGLTDTESVLALVDAKSSLNARRGSDGKTILNILATSGDDPHLVAELLKMGAATSLADNTGKTPLMNAIQNKNYQIFRLILDADKNLWAGSKEWKSVFDYAEEDAEFRSSTAYQELMSRQKN